MYKIEFYENQHGESDVWDFLESLRVKSETSKDARIQYHQILFYIDLLARNGTNGGLQVYNPRMNTYAARQFSKSFL